MAVWGISKNKLDKNMDTAIHDIVKNIGGKHNEEKQNY